MKVKTISRSKDDYVKQKNGDVDKVHHNLDEKYHPFQQQREVGAAGFHMKFVVRPCSQCRKIGQGICQAFHRRSFGTQRWCLVHMYQSQESCTPFCSFWPIGSIYLWSLWWRDSCVGFAQSKDRFQGPSSQPFRERSCLWSFRKDILFLQWWQDD